MVRDAACDTSFSTSVITDQEEFDKALSISAEVCYCLNHRVALIISGKMVVSIIFGIVFSFTESDKSLAVSTEELHSLKVVNH